MGLFFLLIMFQTMVSMFGVLQVRLDPVDKQTLIMLFFLSSVRRELGTEGGPTFDTD